ncbi:MAG: amidohydrolase family protein [Candidatus Dormibacteraceae bacterium]
MCQRGGIATPELVEGSIDAHHHLWDAKRRFPVSGSWFLGALTYGWNEAGVPALDRSFLDSDLAPLLDRAGIARTVVIQAIHGTGETEWLLEVAAQQPRIVGVVGWVELAQPAELVQRDIETLASPYLVGIRHLVQFEKDPAWLLRPDVLAGLKVVAKMGLRYDLLVAPAQLNCLPELAMRIPELPMVLDHLGKPPIREGAIEPWRSQIKAAADNPRLHCKLSGMVTEADHKRWQPAELRPYVEVAMEAFGAERVMFGSDWPVCTLAATYEEVLEATSQNLQDILGGAPAVWQAVFRDNAERFYGLEARGS